MSAQQPLFTGRTAQIYAGDADGTVVKLYPADVPRSQAETELRNTVVAGVAGVSVPATGTVVTIDGRHGFSMELIPGTTLMSQLENGAVDVEVAARLLAKQHVAMTRHRAAGLPPQRLQLQKKLRDCTALSNEQRLALLATLDGLPDDDALCHGDFHPGNVIVQGDDVVVIDWVDASSGSALADLARSVVLFLGHQSGIPNGPELAAMQLFHRTYVQSFLGGAGIRQAELSRWLPVVAAARLREDIPEQRAFLLDLAVRDL